jgi:ferrochelatase
MTTETRPGDHTTGADRKRTGVLLVNLGTPDAPRTPEVRRYLREFLSDPRVIDINPVGRALLLHLIILPFRPRLSAEAYRKIWTEEGSPLLIHSRKLRDEIRGRLSPEIPVELAMRYGNPSIASGLQRLLEARADRIVVLPLYPQTATATTESTLIKVMEEASQLWDVPDLRTFPFFYDDPGFIRSFAEVGRPVIERLEPDLVLMSYHGLPERQVIRSDETGSWCLQSETCCDAIRAENRLCYRAQCFATSRLLADSLGLDQDRYRVTFQSRLGRTPWIRPYTDVTLSELPGREIKRVAVFSPSFVTDCLETLEEIGIRGKNTFLEAGGEAFELIPSLNAHPTWVETVESILRRKIETGI